MKHTIEALNNLKDKIQPEHYRLLCDAMIKDTNEEIEKLRAQLPADTKVAPAPCDRKAIWQNVAIRCENETQQETLASMAEKDGMPIAKDYQERKHRMFAFVATDSVGQITKCSYVVYTETEYDYYSFLTHYNENQCK